MAWVDHEGKRFWVGRHASLGLLVIADANLRAPELRCFIVERRDFGDFLPKMLRENVDARITAEEATRAVETMCTSPPPPSPLGRRAHCYACKSTLRETQKNKCPACNWIICQCGACNC